MTLKYSSLVFCSGGQRRGHWLLKSEGIAKGRGYLFCPEHPGVRLRIHSHHPRRDREHLRI